MIAHGTILSNRYLLENEIGSGGMSVVYQAVDLRTGATVAVKIPHAFLLKDEQYVRRLKREAQIAATIQSSRIALVTDVSEHEGTPYFVMEYVSGESLMDRITRDGPLEPLEALRITLEVARGIDAAHGRGVVHRDLKPQNIALTAGGDVKVLDFGIARMEGRPGLTSASLFIGTPDYAAPERTEGVSDIRSDIYSIGVVLYEMLCGKLPFAGKTPWTVMQMHSTEPPPPMPGSVPGSVRAIVERCLAKRPEDRYQTPRELADDIQRTIRDLERATTSTTPTAAASNVVPVATEFGTAPEGRESGARETIQRPRQETAPLAAPSRASEQRRRVPLAPLLAGVGALVLIAGAAAFFLTRDGSDASDVVPGAGSGFVTPVPGTPGLVVLQPGDGARVTGPVTVQLDVTGVNLKAPVEADPAGRHIHYFLDIDPATVLVPGQPIPTGQANIIHTANSTHTFLDLPPGPHTVWAVLTGNDHVPLTPTVQGKTTFTAVPDPLANARSGDAAPIAYQGLVDGKWRIFVMEPQSENPRRITGGNANDFNPAFSPDGSRIAFNSDRDGTHHIYTMNLDGSDIRRLTNGQSNNRSPAWAPDGSAIVFQSDRDGRDHLWTVPVGGGEPQQITRGPQNDSAPSWSLDGTWIAYQSDAGGGVTHVFVVDRRGGTPRQVTDGPARDNRPVWSPDGRRLAFARFENNQWNIYLMNADGSDVRKLTEGSFNINPSWSPDGRHLLFQSDREGGQQQIFQIPVEGGPAKQVTKGTTINTSPSWPLK